MASESNAVQLIDYEGNFTIDMREFLKTRKMTKGLDYNTVGIIGCQSTGKSTILNLLFGTDFRTMDSTRGRSQTTQGIWLSKALEKDVLVLDLEGTDSKERGEDRTTFEHTSALFTLALADILVVNMWTSDVGRYTASNYPLLKTIFEINLKLFAQQSSRKVIFLLRDFNEQETPLQHLSSMIETDIAQIWTEIQKPEQYKFNKPSDFFEVEFATLSHKVYRFEDFKKDAEDFKRRFYDTDAEDFLFKNINRDLPLDGFPNYVEEVWTQVKSHKELNIPSQKQMVANFRCGEIKVDALKSVEGLIGELARTSEKSFNKNFDDVCKLICKKAMNEYEKLGQYYNTTQAYEERREELKRDLANALKPCFDAQIRYIKQTILKNVKEALKAEFPKGKAKLNFNVKADAIKERALQDFEEAATRVQILPDWNLDITKSEFEDIVDEEVSFFRHDQKKNLITETKNLLKNQLEPEVSRIFSEFAPDMWHQVATCRYQIMEKIEAECCEILNGMGADDDKIRQVLDEVSQTSFDSVKKKVDKISSSLEFHLKQHFNRVFNQDAKGFPRKWNQMEASGIEALYKQALQSCESGLDAFQVMKISKDWRDLPSQANEYKEEQERAAEVTTETPTPTGEEDDIDLDAIDQDDNLVTPGGPQDTRTGFRRSQTLFDEHENNYEKIVGVDILQKIRAELRAYAQNCLENAQERRVQKIGSVWIWLFVFFLARHDVWSVLTSLTSLYVLIPLIGVISVGKAMKMDILVMAFVRNFAESKGVNLPF
eukprot:CAMPEP_0115025700 /NCGR_PEP_ID=MMETSP0216-20121206/34202_1 /TAXON_ID=223996 /ORGANISM="Protocruzia adherens, Strain Boccale" /LENGTH=771 /DNA_ID=CAMNT_0002400425 /DNA_START=34 /DNA_END=2349 /DNA_ORIENTATION=+